MEGGGWYEVLVCACVLSSFCKTRSNFFFFLLYLHYEVDIFIFSIPSKIFGILFKVSSANTTAANLKLSSSFTWIPKTCNFKSVGKYVKFTWRSDFDPFYFSFTSCFGSDVGVSLAASSLSGSYTWRIPAGAPLRVQKMIHLRCGQWNGLCWCLFT